MASKLHPPLKPHSSSSQLHHHLLLPQEIGIRVSCAFLALRPPRPPQTHIGLYHLPLNSPETSIAAAVDGVAAIRTKKKERQWQQQPSRPSLSLQASPPPSATTDGWLVVLPSTAVDCDAPRPVVAPLEPSKEIFADLEDSACTAATSHPTSRPTIGELAVVSSFDCSRPPPPGITLRRENRLKHLQVG